MAAGITMGYSADRLLSAIGLACSTAAGIKSFAGGSGGGMVKRMHAGRSAEAGVRMCEMVDCGFDGPRAAIEGRFGLLEVLSGSSAAPEQLSASLGRQWALEQVWVKVYPICGLIQAAAQVIDDIKSQRPLDSTQIKRVRVGTSEHGVRHNSERLPADTMAAQYSIPYCVGVALAHDAANPASYGPDRLTDPLTRELAACTELYVDDEVEAAYPARFGARVSIELRNGQVYEGYELNPHGTPDQPCTDEELAQKFKRLGRASCSEAQLGTVIKLVSRIEQLDTLQPLSAALRPVTSAT
jgi:2-methylcitrate dehydratase PrpD